MNSSVEIMYDSRPIYLGWGLHNPQHNRQMKKHFQFFHIWPEGLQQTAQSFYSKLVKISVRAGEGR